MSERIEIAEHENRGTYDVWHNGEKLPGRTRTPLLTSARYLIAQGVDPDATIEMVRRGSDRVDMSARIGEAALLSVSEPPKGNAPHFVRYSPFDWSEDCS